MRLAAALLISLGLCAQEPAAALPWRAVAANAEVPAPFREEATTGPLKVQLTVDGSLKVFDGRGIRWLWMGLPGRPWKVWRDAGIPVKLPVASLAFPLDTPLRRGLGSLPLDAPDFRPALQGLLWMLDDSGRLLTVLHPSTCQVVRFHLPETEDTELRFHPDRLELTSSEGWHWTVSWIALLPQFLQLGRPAKLRPLGTALEPYPKG